MLAAYDYSAYPLYKEEVFQDIKHALCIDKKLGTVSENYSTYVDLCQAVLSYLRKDHPELTMLDIQDFFL
ncbi:hypothetical protein ACI2OX_03535 [Bacillus sp. N9]